MQKWLKTAKDTWGKLNEKQKKIVYVAAPILLSLLAKRAKSKKNHTKKYAECCKAPKDYEESRD